MKNYIMIGAGGTGTHLIGKALAYLDAHHRNEGTDWTYVVIDGDAFEDKNADRQLFDAGFISANKANAMAEMYNRYPIIAVPRFIGREDLETLIQEGDTILICADNHSIRALVQERALALNDVVVINAGNELSDGNVQLWVREQGQNVTPKLTYQHPEITYIGAEDRSAMSCQQAAQLPGGGQLILANAQAADWMLAALHRHLTGDFRKTGRGEGWTEIQFDAITGIVNPIDMRERRNWSN